MSVDRREFLKISAVGTLGIAGLTVPLGAAVSTAGESLLAPANFPAQYRYPFVRPPVLKPYEWGFDEAGKFERYNLSQQVGTASIVPGLTTTLTGYNGIFPGPIISVDQGTRVDLHMRNELALPGAFDGHTIRTSTHLHGSASLPQYDGYADDIASHGRPVTAAGFGWWLAASLVGRQLKTSVRHLAPRLGPLAANLLDLADDTLAKGRFDPDLVRAVAA